MSGKIDLERCTEGIALLWTDTLEHRNAPGQHTDEMLSRELDNAHDIAALKMEDTL